MMNRDLESLQKCLDAINRRKPTKKRRERTIFAKFAKTQINRSFQNEPPIIRDLASLFGDFVAEKIDEELHRSIYRE